MQSPPFIPFVIHTSSHRTQGRKKQNDPKELQHVPFGKSGHSVKHLLPSISRIIPQIKMTVPIITELYHLSITPCPGPVVFHYSAQAPLCVPLLCTGPLLCSIIIRRPPCVFHYSAQPPSVFHYSVPNPLVCSITLCSVPLVFHYTVHYSPHVPLPPFLFL